MIPNHFKRAVWGILMAAAGDRQRGDLLAATGEDLMTVDNILQRPRNLLMQSDPARRDNRSHNACRKNAWLKR